MISLYVYNYIFFISIPIINSIILVVFFKSLYQNLNKKNTWDNRLVSFNDLKLRQYIYILDIFIIFFFLFMIISLTSISQKCNIWWSYLKLNDNLIYLYFLINFILILYILININNYINNSIEYNISISSIILFLPLVFFSNNLYSFFFFIRAISFIYIFSIYK